MKLFVVIIASCFVFTIHVQVASKTHDKKVNFYLHSLNSTRHAKSCLDFLKDGKTESGFYQIFDDSVSRFTVYCDFTSEPGSAWTLAMSHTKDRHFLPQFRVFLSANLPVNEKTANWHVYRMGLSMMKSVASRSTHWRYTCSFPENGVDYMDYVRATFSSMNPLTFVGNGHCRVMEYIDVRGTACTQCSAQWRQPKSDRRILHMNSYKSKCAFKTKEGATKLEDNFGYYDNTNRQFRCTASGTSTTNLWFGGYL